MFCMDGWTLFSPDLQGNRNLVVTEVETRTLEEVHEVLRYATQNKTSLTRMMLDNMVVPLPSGDVDVSMLKEAVGIINGRFETEKMIDKNKDEKMISNFDSPTFWWQRQEMLLSILYIKLDKLGLLTYPGIMTPIEIFFISKLAAIVKEKLHCFSFNF
ncbi:hypothetical protein CSA_004747 [Cucumis sativus]|uniref:Uncharacterized protein n=1 Tax=Cucumis sativus TaxID=3659 RepID=A0ACB6HCA8_CUCSA|nr:hypothetical protein CSA_004747 [Cucumis sativus]